MCMRITVNGARVENNIRMSIEPALWSQAKECAKGKSRKACDLNAYIEDARIKLHQLFNEMEEQGQLITARILQERFFGQDKEPEAAVPSSAPCRSTTTNAAPSWARTMP